MRQKSGSGLGSSLHSMSLETTNFLSKRKSFQIYETYKRRANILGVFFGGYLQWEKGTRRKKIVFPHDP